MSRRMSGRSVEIFNFSFLDVLACTAGLLIFILVMVFILQSGGNALVDIDDLVKRRAGVTDQLKVQAIQDEQLASRLGQELGKLPQTVSADLLARRDETLKIRDRASRLYAAAEAEARAAATELQRARQRQVDFDTAHAEARRAHEAARADRDQARRDLEEAKRNPPTLIVLQTTQDANEKAYEVLHVDCQVSHCVLMYADARGRPQALGQTPRGEIADAHSSYRRTVKEHSKKQRPLVLFWIRPSGLSTFEKARNELPSGMDVGWELIDSTFTFDSKPK